MPSGLQSVSSLNIFYEQEDFLGDIGQAGQSFKQFWYQHPLSSFLLFLSLFALHFCILFSGGDGGWGQEEAYISVTLFDNTF